MLRVIIACILTAALAVAIAITFREDVGLRWFGPDFIAPGADLPEAKLGEKPPAAPVIHVSREWITVRAKRVASADEAISDPDSVVDGLYEELYSIGEPPGKWDRSYLLLAEIGIPRCGPVIIQADRDVEYGLISRVLYTCGRAEYGSYLAAINPESRELEAFSVDLPWCDNTGLYPGVEKPIPEFALIVEDNSFKLSYRDASGWYVFSTVEKGYYVLAEDLKQMKRRRPGQKSLLIICASHVKYEELVHIIEVSIQPGIALTEIYLAKLIEDLDK